MSWNVRDLPTFFFFFPMEVVWLLIEEKLDFGVAYYICICINIVCFYRGTRKTALLMFLYKFLFFNAEVMLTWHCNTYPTVSLFIAVVFLCTTLATYTAMWFLLHGVLWTGRWTASLRCQALILLDSWIFNGKFLFLYFTLLTCLASEEVFKLWFCG